MFPKQPSKSFIITLFLVIMSIFTGGSIFSPVPNQNMNNLTNLHLTTEIIMGETVQGRLAEGDEKLSADQFVDKYTFTGTAGQLVAISLTTFDFDAFLWLLDDTQQVIAINDDAGDGAGALISDFSLPKNGVYTLWASSHDPDETGDYSLTLNEAPVLTSPSQVSIGTNVQGVLSNNSRQLSSGQFYQTYQFTATYGQALSIVMESTQINAYLWLLDDQGRVITINDDARLNSAANAHFIYIPVVLRSTQANARQTNGGQTTKAASQTSQIIFIPPTSATYYLLASSSSPQELGTYRLSLQTIASPTTAIPLSGTLSGQLDETDFQLNAGQFLDVYAFEGTSGQQVSLSLSSTAFDSYLRILDSQGNVIKEDDDSGTLGDALIANFALPATGNYYVWVSSAFARSLGNYTLSLSPQKNLSLSQSDSPQILIDLMGQPKLTAPQNSGNSHNQSATIQTRGKGEPFTNAFRPVGSTKPYTAKVKICPGMDTAFTATVNLSGPSGVVIDPVSRQFTVSPNGCTTLSPFNITFATAQAGVKPISATVSGLGSDSEDLTIFRTEIIDEEVNHSLSNVEDSDNFFLRQNEDYKNLDIYYRIAFPDTVPDFTVTIHFYEEDTETKTSIEGAKNSSGFESGEMIHVSWDELEISTCSDASPDFYRVQLEITIDGQSDSYKTPIDDADSSISGWQVPEGGLGIHDLVCKHRPIIYLHANEPAGNGPTDVSTMLNHADLIETDGINELLKNAPISLDDLYKTHAIIGDPDEQVYADQEIVYLDLNDDFYPPTNLTLIPTLYFYSITTSDAVFLQFWHFELTSGFRAISFHEGDWEMIQIAIPYDVMSLDAEQNGKVNKDLIPVGATASQHYYAQTLKWSWESNLDKGWLFQDQDYLDKQGYKPIVYIALQGHGTYFRPGEFNTELGEDDESLFGYNGTQLQYQTEFSTSSDETSRGIKYNYNLKYLEDRIRNWKGHWGEPSVDPPEGPRSPGYRGTGGPNPITIMIDNPIEFHDKFVKNGQGHIRFRQ